jgi:hypothetical protein
MAVSDLVTTLVEEERGLKVAWRPDASDEDDPGQRRRVFLGDHLSKTLAADIRREFTQMRMRLIGEQPELFSTVDRLRSEAVLRFAIAPPLLALAAAIGWKSVWWAGAVVATAAPALALQGRQRALESNAALVEAMRIGRVEAPSAEPFHRALTLLEETDEPVPQDDFEGFMRLRSIRRLRDEQTSQPKADQP